MFRHSIPNQTSCSIFGMIFLNTNEKNSVTVKHEFGHAVQGMLSGPISYLVFVALPSVIYCKTGDYLLASSQQEANKMYFSKVWERTADYFGGVDRKNYFDFWEIENFIFW